MNYIFFALAIFIVENHGESVFVPAPVSQQCLQCICQSTTGCNAIFDYANEHRGIFRLSKKYWVSAGSPLRENATFLNIGNTFGYGYVERIKQNEDELQFADCVLDVTCATKTVQLYMDKNQRDCDGDGVIDCYDYGALHYLGPEGCETPPPNAQFFRDCSKPQCIMI